MTQCLSGSFDQNSAGAPGRTSMLVTLRGASDAAKPPLFCVSSAGGTVGAYRKLAAALSYGGEIVGVRDSYISGERDLTEDFDKWVGRYLDAMQARCPSGPYCIVAYSSAGAFGFELARRLRQQGAEVSLLALIDPLGIEGDRWHRFGWWALRSTHSHAAVRAFTRFVGALRRPAGALLRALAKRQMHRNFTISAKELGELFEHTARTRNHLMALAALMELNTGLPLDLSDAEIPPEPPDSTLRALQARMAEFMPELDGHTIERIAVQYIVQLRAQRAYALAPYDGRTLLIEPVTPYAGLLAAQFSPYLSDLRVVQLALGVANARAAAITGRFGVWAPHFLSMRDDVFSASVARELDRALLGGERTIQGSLNHQDAAAR